MVVCFRKHFNNIFIAIVSKIFDESTTKLMQRKEKYQNVINF